MVRKLKFDNAMNRRAKTGVFKGFWVGENVGDF